MFLYISLESLFTEKQLICSDVYGFVGCGDVGN